MTTGYTVDRLCRSAVEVTVGFESDADHVEPIFRDAYSLPARGGRPSHRPQRLYRRRNDAESINRALDDTLWLRRAHSIGHERQHLNLLTFALGVNSLALHRHRSRTSDPPSARAAA